MKVARLLFDFGVWAYPQLTLDDSVEDNVLGQLVDEHVASQTPDVANAEIRDFPQEKLPAPLWSYPGPCTTLVDEHVVSLTARTPDQDPTSLKADNRGLDDVLFLDGMESEEFGQELEAIEARELVTMTWRLRPKKSPRYLLYQTASLPCLSTTRRNPELSSQRF